MKKLSIVFLILFSALLLCSCTKPSFKPDEKVFFSRPKDTNLEFWITQDVKDIDLSEYECSHGLVGARKFYGKGYNEDSPKKVAYTMTSYPDFSDGGRYITEISITDPNILVYGLTINSATHEFDETMRGHGFSISMNGNYMVAKKVESVSRFCRGEH